MARCITKFRIGIKVCSAECRIFYYYAECSNEKCNNGECNNGDSRGAYVPLF